MSKVFEKFFKKLKTDYSDLNSEYRSVAELSWNTCKDEVTKILKREYYYDNDGSPYISTNIVNKIKEL